MAAFESLALYGVPLVLLVFVLMEVIKKYIPSVRDGPAFLVTLGLGLFLSLCAKLATIFPWFDEWFAVAFAGLMIALLASGFYNGVKKRPDPVEEPSSEFTLGPPPFPMYAGEDPPQRE
jgi:hypothetical protein